MGEQQAAESVYECLLEFGQQRTNPVLSVIGDEANFQSGRHYPEPYLTFAGQGVRAYYHSHEHPKQEAGEHGHFHLFIRIEENSWTHLAALSMDQQGQGKRWLSTNRWVTDECWQSATELQALSLPKLQTTTLSLTERWLYAMLFLYRKELTELWRERDHTLSGIKAHSADTDILENREHYILAGHEINLLNKMQQVLQL